jgi:hypothetical protein
MGHDGHLAWRASALTRMLGIVTRMDHPGDLISGELA